jgi:hypothetical protein
LCAPEKQADGAESLMLCIVVLSPAVYVNYVEIHFVTIRKVSDLSETPSVAQFTCRKRLNYVETLFYLATVNSHCLSACITYTALTCSVCVSDT